MHDKINLKMMPEVNICRKALGMAAVQWLPGNRGEKRFKHLLFFRKF
jgi:hypothetical protein